MSTDSRDIENINSISPVSKYLNNLVLIQNSESHKNHLNDLKSLLVIELSKQSKLNDTIQIQILPLKEAPTKFKNYFKDGKWYMVYRFNEELKIHKPEFIHLNNSFDSKTNQENISAIFKLYSFDIPPSGIYTKYSIGGRFLFQEEYDQQKLKKFKGVLPKKESTSEIQHNGEGNIIEQNSMYGSDCIDWYLVTTVYYSDGSSYQYESYVTTTCSSSCSPSTTDYTEAVECDPDGSDGGWNNDPDDESQTLSANPNWIVAANPLGSYTVMSYEKFTGERGPNYHKFLTAQHVTSEVFSIPSANPSIPWARWQEISALTTIENDWVAKALVHGKITFSNNGSQPVSEYHLFSFSSLW